MLQSLLGERPLAPRALGVGILLPQRVSTTGAVSTSARNPVNWCVNDSAQTMTRRTLLRRGASLVVMSGEEIAPPGWPVANSDRTMMHGKPSRRSAVPSSHRGEVRQQ